MDLIKEENQSYQPLEGKKNICMYFLNEYQINAAFGFFCWILLKVVCQFKYHYLQYARTIEMCEPCYMST